MEGMVMEEIAVSKFKATCLAVVERVRRTGKPVRITKFGRPVAEVVPTRSAKPKKRKLGTMAGTVKIIGDIISPATPLEDWDALRK